MSRTRLTRIVTAAIAFIATAALVLHSTHWTAPIYAKIFGRKTIADRIAEYGPPARERWRTHFANATILYPPKRVTLVALKEEKQLLVYASDDGPHSNLIRRYPVLAASGKMGPKLRRGDNQVPEGCYAIESLNPNSRFHLALRVGYPNEFDRAMAAKDGRKELSADIMIHGSDASVGCLAMGDGSAEDLFVLAADVGIEHVNVIIAPRDLRRLPAPQISDPAWTAQLYAQIGEAMHDLP